MVPIRHLLRKAADADFVQWGVPRARLEFPLEITAISQYMQGDTAVGASADGRGRIIAGFEAWFLLLSQRYGSHRYTTRYDHMNTAMVRGAPVLR